MNMLSPRGRKRNNRKFSNVRIYHNRQFPLNDMLDVLYPLFAPFYPYDEFLNMIYTSDHIFCAYDQRQNRCIACALINNVRKGRGLYLVLFGVRQSSQSRGTGTHLLEAIIQWAYQTGHAFIYLHVHAGNYKAIGLYEKVGFSRHEYLPNYYNQTSKQPPDAIRMVLSFY